MTRLVLHAGAEQLDDGVIQPNLVEWRDALASAGVVLPQGDTRAEWRRTAAGFVHPGVAAEARSLLTEARESGASLIVVSSDILSDALTSPEHTEALAAMAASAGVSVRVVVAVREQIGYINDLYCRRVLSLETARSFEEFAATAVPAHRFDFVASFGAIADTDGVELVAVPYPRIRTEGAGRAVLRAAGVDEDVIMGLTEPVSVPAPLPGPALVAATRLLHKRMRRMRMFASRPKHELRAVAEALATRAQHSRWDATPYWGWTEELQRQAEEEYAESNAVFAEYVWGDGWQEPWSNRPAYRTELADLEPTVVRDALTTVDNLMRSLTRPGS